ncbi:hypothetical protein [Streptomyces sp. B6B3]|uniref:hypothetical protein n=1 Tax=Streptomyces sp. B6B3 TaxID=3153570 RepID=UPI00325EAA43
MTGSPVLGRREIERALRRLGDRLVRRGVIAGIYVFGGVAMALAYDARRATRDIDAVFVPHGVVLEEARAVGEQLGLPPWWLDEQGSAFVAPGGDPDAPRIFDHPGLRLSAASPRHLLAMKVLASRPPDAEDIAFLVKSLNLGTVDEILAVCADVFPDEPVPGRARLLLEDVLGEHGWSASCCRAGGCAGERRVRMSGSRIS